MTAMYATEFQSIRPTRSFDRAIRAAEAEADERQAPSAVYENGRVTLYVDPAEYTGASLQPSSEMAA